MNKQMWVFVLLVAIVRSITREEQYYKLRGIVSLRKQATISQYKNQERKTKTFHDSMIGKIEAKRIDRDAVFDEWNLHRERYITLRQITTHIQTMMSLLKHYNGLMLFSAFREGILFNQAELEKMSSKFGDYEGRPEQWQLTHKEIQNLRYFERIADPNEEALMNANYQLMRIVNFFQPYEKQFEELRLDYSQRLTGLTQDIKNLLEQLELNQDATEIDQYEFDKQLLLHDYELDLIDDELVQLKGYKSHL